MDIRKQVIALNEERVGLFAQQDKLLAATRGRERSQEEIRTLERMDARVDEIDAQVRTMVDREKRESEAGQLRETHGYLFGRGGDAFVDRAHSDENVRLREWARGNGGPIDVDIRGIARERELVRQGASPQEVRALAWDTGSVASGVPTLMARSVYETLEAFTTMFRAPTTKLSTDSGAPIKIPKVNAHAIATQVSGQGTLLAGTDPTFLSLQLDAFKYGELIIVAEEVLTDTNFDIASFLGREIGRAIGRVVDRDLTVGTGSGQPNGIMTAVVGAGTIATGGSLISPTYESLVNLMYSVPDAYRSSGNAGWLMHDTTAGTLRKLRDNALAAGTSGAVMWSPSLTNGIVGSQPDLLLGYPVFTGAYVASQGSNAKIIGFGDFSAYWIRHVGNIQVDIDASRFFDADQRAFRGKWRLDGDLVDLTGAFNAMKMSV